jgi:cytosine deaminase
MMPAPSILPPLRLPRALLDPCEAGLPCPDADGLVTVRLAHHQGRICAIQPCSPGEAGMVDAPLALTPPVEPHAHLDKAYSWPQFPNRKGTLEGALEANLREAQQRSRELVLERGERALSQAWRHGLRAVRSHIDSLGPAGQASWEALVELRQRWRGRVELQLVALVALDHWLTPEGERLAAQVVASGGLLGGVLGAPFLRGPHDRRALAAVLTLAQRYGCAGIDLHIDESDADHGRGLELLCQVLRPGHGGPPLTCSHASSMGLLPERRCRRLAERLAERQVRVVALPTTNLWLLGRRPASTPCLRPQAPIHQLQAAGVEVAIGGDNVRDPWYPGGDFDPVDLMRFAMPACHLMPWQREGISPFCSAAARLLELEWDGVIRLGCPADLLVLDVADWSELLARPPRRRVLRDGCWLPEVAADAPHSRLRPFLAHDQSGA